MIVSVIIPVAGQGKRFKGTIPKQYLNIYGQSIIAITVQKFIALDIITYGIIVAAENEIENTASLLNKLPGFSDKFKIVAGGKERQDSVFQGLQNIPPDTDIVVVHDGVRPLISSKIIIESIKMTEISGACVVAVPVKDTIKRVTGGRVIETLPREDLWQVQTPQVFKYPILKAAHDAALSEGYYSTDESALVEWMGHTVKIVHGEYSNIKITTEDDLNFAQLFYKEQQAP